MYNKSSIYISPREFYWLKQNIWKQGAP